jgi:hypothetical protein
VLLLLSAACSGLKHVPKGELLYTGSKVQIITSDKLKDKGKVKQSAKSITPDATCFVVVLCGKAFKKEKEFAGLDKK